MENNNLNSASDILAQLNTEVLEAYLNRLIDLDDSSDIHMKTVYFNTLTHIGCYNLYHKSTLLGCITYGNVTCLYVNKEIFKAYFTSVITLN